MRLIYAAAKFQRYCKKNGVKIFLDPPPCTATLTATKEPPMTTYVPLPLRASLQDARRARSQRTAQAVLDALTRPMTRTDICHKLGISEVTATRALQNLHEAGKVTSTRVHSSKVWERNTSL
jgi:CRP-like cAMP-binding protein